MQSEAVVFQIGFSTVRLQLQLIIWSKLSPHVGKVQSHKKVVAKSTCVYQCLRPSCATRTTSVCLGLDSMSVWILILLPFFQKTVPYFVF